MFRLVGRLIFLCFAQKSTIQLCAESLFARSCVGRPCAPGYMEIRVSPCIVGRKVALCRKVDITTGLREVCAGSFSGEFNFASDCGAANMTAVRETSNSCGAAARGR